MPHLLVWRFVRTVWALLKLPSDSLAAAIGFSALAMLAALATAIVVYRYLEKPVTDALHAVYYARLNRARVAA